MAFEKFTLTGKSFTPIVSIWSRGQIGFSKGAINRFKLENVEYVIFYFDKGTERIGFKFTGDSNEEGAVKLNQRSTGTSVSAKKFFDFYDIDYGTTRQFTLNKDEESGLLFINLTEIKQQ